MLKARTKIFVKPNDKVEKVGSILLATSAQKTVEEGTVIYGFDDLPSGTKVVYDKALTLQYNDGKEELLVIDPDDIWAIVEEKE